MSRQHSHKWETGMRRDPNLDPVQRLLVAKIEDAFLELWPSSLRAPAALDLIHLSVLDLVRHTARTERGRKSTARRTYRRWAELAFYDPRDTGMSDTNDLMKHPHARKVIADLPAPEPTPALDPMQRQDFSNVIALFQVLAEEWQKVKS